MLKKFEMKYPIEQKIQDMNVLEGIMKGSISLDALKDDEKRRLIMLCGERIDSLETKIYGDSMKSDDYRKYELSFKKLRGNYKNS